METDALVLALLLALSMNLYVMRRLALLAETSDPADLAEEADVEWEVEDDGAAEEEEGGAVQPPKKKKRKRGKPKPKATTGPADPAPPTTGGGGRLFAPYLETWKTHNLGAIPAKSFTLAFLLSKNGKLAWNGTEPLGKMTGVADAIRAKGGQVVLSFGGAAGKELALDVKDPADLARQYGAAAKQYGSTWLDFDIEGGAIADVAANTRRNKALASLQRTMPGLTIAFTLAVMPTGLLEDALKMLRDAKAQGVRVGCVNLMTMDYGDSFRGDMGGYAIQAAKSAYAQLQSIGLRDTKVGITPMIGKNDNGPNPFSLANARAVVQFAQSTPWVGLLAFWAVGRDNGRKSTLSESSMVPQKDYDFTRAFAAFA